MRRSSIVVLLAFGIVLSVWLVRPAPEQVASAAIPLQQSCGPDRPCTATPSGSATPTATLTATTAVATASPSPAPFQTPTPLPASFVYRLYVISVQR